MVCQCGINPFYRSPLPMFTQKPKINFIDQQKLTFKDDTKSEPLNDTIPLNYVKNVNDTNLLETLFHDYENEKNETNMLDVRNIFNRYKP